jgi:hypothetical protein
VNSPTALVGPCLVESADSAPARGPGFTVDQVLASYWEHVERYDRTPDGKPTSEPDAIRRSHPCNDSTRQMQYSITSAFVGVNPAAGTGVG